MKKQLDTNTIIQPIILTKTPWITKVYLLYTSGLIFLYFFFSNNHIFCFLGYISSITACCYLQLMSCSSFYPTFVAFSQKTINTSYELSSYRILIINMDFHNPDNMVFRDFY